MPSNASNHSQSFVDHYLSELHCIQQRLDAAQISQAIEWLREVRDRGRTVFICGNGGSACIASQMVVDVLKGGSFGKKKRFKMIGLTDNIATITAYGNDEGYATVFVEQLRNFAESGDLLIAISGSGNSENVLRAVEYANSVGCRTIGLTTADGGKLRDMVTLPLLVPGRHMGRLEDCFFIVTHILAYAFIEGE
jgi:D-sedoheptulose 7-phosphate isomerase